jgi:acyl-CoA thioester hydrolase
VISTLIQVRFADIDLAGHVHNAAYLHYFESARMGFFVETLGKGWDWKKNGFVLKKNLVEYEQPVYLTDRITVEVCTAHIGEKSFTLAYLVKDQHGVLKTKGESVIVCFDFTEGKTIAIPEEVKTILAGHLQS